MRYLRIFGGLSCAVGMLLTTARAVGQTTVSCPGAEILFFDNWDTSRLGALNGGKPTEVNFGSDSYCITRIATYHWNGGKGASPGTISLQDATGRIVGTWQARSSSGQLNAPDVNWDVFPPAGTVASGRNTVFDSDPSTWSQNGTTNGFGFVKIWGRKVLGETSTGAFKIRQVVFPDGKVGTAYKETAIGADAAKDPVTWTATGLPPGLTITRVRNPALVSGTPTQAGDYTVTIRATDATGQSDVAFVAIRISTEGCPNTPLTVETRSFLEPGTLGQEYRPMDDNLGDPPTLRVTGGCPPYNWQLISGKLPPGMYLSPNGQLSGTPIESSSGFEFTVLVRDGSGKSASKQFTLGIFSGVRITTERLGQGTVGKAYTATLQAIGGTGPYEFTCTDLPPGLTCAPKTGVISGTPTKTGNYTISVIAKDSRGTVSREVKIPLLIANPSISLKSGKAGELYADKIVAPGGTGQETVKAVSGNPPDGLKLGPTGTVDGTPLKAGNFTFTVEIGGVAYDVSVTIVAASGLKFKTTSPLPTGKMFQSYGPVSIEVEGGCKPYRYALLGPSPFNPQGFALPLGLSLNPDTGVISGKPAEIVDRAVTVIVTDACGGRVEQQFRIKVDAADPLSIKVTAPETNEAGARWDMTPAGSGGNPEKYKWSVSISGPNGGIKVLTIDPATGQARFGSEIEGDYNITWTLEDGSSKPATIQIPVKVNPQSIRMEVIPGSQFVPTYPDPEEQETGPPTEEVFGVSGGATPGTNTPDLYDGVLEGVGFYSQGGQTSVTLQTLPGDKVYTGLQSGDSVLFSGVQLNRSIAGLRVGGFFEGTRLPSELQLRKLRFSGQRGGAPKVTVADRPTPVAGAGTAIMPSLDMYWDASYNQAALERFLRSNGKDQDELFDEFLKNAQLRAFVARELGPGAFVSAGSQVGRNRNLRAVGTKIAAVTNIPAGVSVYLPTTDTTGSLQLVDDPELDSVAISSTAPWWRRVIGPRPNQQFAFEVKKSDPNLRETYSIPFLFLGLDPAGPAPPSVDVTIEASPTDCLNGLILSAYPCYKKNALADRKPYRITGAPYIIESIASAYGPLQAPGGRAVIRGSFEPPFESVPPDQTPGTTLAGRQVNVVDRQGRSYPCTVLSVEADRIVFAIAADAPTDVVTISVTGGTPAVSTTTRLRPVAPALDSVQAPTGTLGEAPQNFAVGTVSYGSVVTPLIVTFEDGSRGPVPVQIMPDGETVIALSSTGLRGRSGKPGSVKVKVSGVEVPFLSASAAFDAPESWGKDEIRFSLPNELKARFGGLLVDVMVDVDGILAQPVTLKLQ